MFGIDDISALDSLEETLWHSDKDVGLTIHPPFGDDGHELSSEIRDSYRGDAVGFINQPLAADEQGDYVLNETVLGRTDVDNTLKGMSVVFDDAKGLAYVTGIMTDAVSVLDVANGSLERTFYLTDHVPAPKRLAFDGLHRRLWVVANAANPTLWLADPDAGTVLASRAIGGDLGSGAGNYPVWDAVVDPQREILFVLLSDVSGQRVALYDTTLNSVESILVGRDVWALRWDESRDALLALTAPALESAAASEIFILPQGSETLMTSIEINLGTPPPTRPPTAFTFEPSGDFFLAGQGSLWRIDGASGAQVWEASLPYQATAIDLSGSEVGVLHQYGSPRSRDIYVSRLSTFDAGTGVMLAVRNARYEASWMDASPSLGGFVVGNGGDASVSLFPAGAAVGTDVKVGTAAEDILVTPDGERMLVLNRLGGSQLIEYELATGSGRVLNAVPWPVRMIQRPADQKLFVFSHFEPKVVVRDLETLEVLREISLVPHGVTASYSDTLSDMAADPDGDLLVALQCEQGKVAVIDGATESVLAVVSLGGALPSGGPGRMNAAVDTSDPSNRRVFVYLADDNRLYRLEEADDFAPHPYASAVVSVAPSVQDTYAFRSVYYSPSINTVFVWNVAVDPDTLVAGSAVSGVERFIGEADGALYAQHQTASGVNQTESLVAVDALSLDILHEQVLAETMAMDSKVYLDFDRWAVAFTRPASSEAHLTEIEFRSITVTGVRYDPILQHNIPNLRVRVDGLPQDVNFLDFYDRTGGLTRWGYATSEVLEETPGTLTQYYQRGVVDWHQAADGSWRLERRLAWDYVGGGQGGSVDQGVEPGLTNPNPGDVVGEWGHKVSNYSVEGLYTGFKDFFDRLGGADSFGHAKTDARYDDHPQAVLHAPDTDLHWIRQYFQAGVLEYHPEDPGDPVKLTLLGDTLRNLQYPGEAWRGLSAFLPADPLTEGQQLSLD